MSRRTAHAHADAHQDASLAALTSAKWAANAAFRWIPPFLPTLERGLGTTTGTLTTILGIGELAGLATAPLGRWLDRGHERTALLGGMALTVVSCALAATGSVAAFAASYVLLVLGVSVVTVSGHAWIAARTPFERRGRSIGLFETSWALALLLGAPLAGLLVSQIGWRAPLAAWVVACVVTALVVHRVVPADRPHTPSAVHQERALRLPASAWRTIIGSGAIAAAGIAVFVVSGAWLEDAFGLSAGGIGVVAMGFGVLELVASLLTTRVTDRIGKPRAVGAGVLFVAIGLALMASAGDRVAVGVAGITIFLAGFEFGFVSSLSLLTEAAPEARGRAVGVGNAAATILRSGAAVASGVLYERFGIGGSVGLAAASALVSAALLVRPQRRGAAGAGAGLATSLG